MTALLVLAKDPTPEPADVTAGWVAFGIFIGLCVATAVICYFMARQLRKAREHKDAGNFDSGPEATAGAKATGSEPHSN